MKRFLTVIAVVAILIVASTAGFAELKLPAMFTSGAVLQQGSPAPVWGWADPGAEVSVVFAGQTKTATADAEGEWTVTLDALETNAEPATITVTSGSETLDVENVLVGEVWYCSGQSNMEWVVGNSVKTEDIDFNTLPMIRHIKVPHVRVGEPADDFVGEWQVCDENTVNGFTAVGFYHAYFLNRELNVPIGLIGCNWGGTKIEPWTPPAGFDAVDELDPATLSDTSTMYNGMTAAVQPYAVAGAIWYQGESNGGEGITYFHKMRALIAGLRATWEIDDLPFYFVQLANYREPNPEPAGGDGWALHREAQLQTISAVENSGMAVIIDIGEAGDIHPKNKYDVGKRLALWALANDYGMDDLVYSGPLYREMAVEGGTIRLAFDHVGRGLMAAKKEGPQSIEPPTPVDELAGFAIAGEDKVWVWADAKIDGDTVVVSSPDVEAPVAVRYGFSNNPDTVNLYNEEGLPASPFRTDAW